LIVSFIARTQQVCRFLTTVETIAGLIVSFIARTQQICRFLTTVETIAGLDRFIHCTHTAGLSVFEQGRNDLPAGSFHHWRVLAFFGLDETIANSCPACAAQNTPGINR
jgi:hypothetical protein